MTKKDPLADKRKHAEIAMLAFFEARARAWRDDPTMDISSREVLNATNAAEVRAILAKAPEYFLDQLIARYDPRAAGPRYVW